MQKTLQQYDQASSHCREIFLKKNHDYGTAWRILRVSSLTDQIFIKASRIRSIEEKGEQKVADSVETEYRGIVNYCLMALIQLEIGEEAPQELEEEVAKEWYDRELELTRQLMIDKNSDYGEAWRDMRVSSFTDLILMKLLRVKQIEDLGGKTLISEGLDANFRDILNYSMFALIKLT